MLKNVWLIGQSVTGGHGVVLTVERVGNDLAFSRFEVDHYGFWFVLDEFLLFTEAEEGTIAIFDGII